MRIVLIIVSCLVSMGMISCEPCKDRVGKEQIQISQSTAIIDSIAISPSIIKFSKRDAGTTNFYSTGWTNIDETSLQITVYTNPTSVTLDFPIKDDQFFYIVLSDVSEGICAQVGHSTQSWETVINSNIEACFYYEELECP